MRFRRLRTRLVLACAVALATACTTTGFAQSTPTGHEPGAAHASPAELGEPQLGVPIPIFDPGGHALDAFHAALRRTEKGGQAHLVFYGASHVASDLFTGYIRRALQTRFGDAGHGYVMPAKPWRWYRHADVNIESTNRWHTDRVNKKDDRKDGWYGLAGMTVSSSSKKDFAKVSTTHDNELGRNVSRFELYVLRQPGGGRADIRIDGKLVRRIDTGSIEYEAAYERFDVKDGSHTFEIRPKGDGEVRIFGLTLDRDVPGVVVDTLGINGSRAQYQLEWNESVVKEQLARRKPDLIVLAYGTNEAGDDDDPIEDYETRLRQVMSRAKVAAPGASCLLIGPSDRPLKMPDGSLGPRPRTGQLIEVQRRVSAQMGCGFFDLVAFQGGEMSMLTWVAADPPMAAKDYVHYSRKGYERLGEVLLQALMAGFDPAHVSLP